MNTELEINIVSPDGERIELLTTESEAFAKGAKEGAEALLNLFMDEMELEEGYRIELAPTNLSVENQPGIFQ